MNEARIRTCTKDPRQRLLFVGIALVLRNGWGRRHVQLAQGKWTAEPQLYLQVLRFNEMLLWITQVVQRLLRADQQQGIDRQTYERLTTANGTSVRLGTTDFVFFLFDGNFESNQEGASSHRGVERRAVSGGPVRPTASLLRRKRISAAKRTLRAGLESMARWESCECDGTPAASRAGTHDRRIGRATVDGQPRAVLDQVVPMTRDGLQRLLHRARPTTWPGRKVAMLALVVRIDRREFAG
jgi:hypothetical protein